MFPLRQSLTKLRNGCEEDKKVYEIKKDALRQKFEISKQLRILINKIRQHSQTIQYAHNTDPLKMVYIRKFIKAIKQLYLFKIHCENKNIEILRTISIQQLRFKVLNRKFKRAQQNVCQMKTLENQIIELEQQQQIYERAYQLIQQEFDSQNVSIDELQIKAQGLEQQNRNFEIDLQQIYFRIVIITEQILQIRRDMLEFYVNPSKLQHQALSNIIQNPYGYPIQTSLEYFKEIRGQLEEIYKKCKEKQQLNQESEILKIQIDTNKKIQLYHDSIRNYSYKGKMHNQQEDFDDILLEYLQKVSEIEQIIKNIKTIPLLYNRIKFVGKSICDYLNLNVTNIQDSINLFKRLQVKRRQIDLSNILNTQEQLQQQNAEDMQIEQNNEEGREHKNDSQSVIQQQLLIINHQALQHNAEVLIQEEEQLRENLNQNEQSKNKKN